VTYFLGLDLGQAQDPTAIAVLERRDLAQLFPPLPHRIPMRGQRPKPAPPDLEFRCRHLERLRLNISYPAIADYVVRLLGTPELAEDTQLIVDATGVGRPVVDMLRARGLKPIAVTITGGDKVTFEKGWRVPKRDLVGAVQVLLQTDRLKFAEQIPAIPLLVQEMLAFRVKIDPLTAHDSYGAWREGDRDDMVLAVAIAAWWGQRHVTDSGTFSILKARM
jgi:hypothetical protein